MSSAGQQLLAGRIPGERIAVVENTSDSSTFTTTEVVLITLVVPMVEGRTYSIYANPGFASSVAGDSVRCHLREGTTTAGTERDGTTVNVDQTTGGTRKAVAILRYDHVATATAEVSFVVTAERVNGTGNCLLEGATNRRSYFEARYESG